jgi:broad specificity phosphatase PhoE
MSSSLKLIMIRHGRINARYNGLCYGQSDVELSEEGMDQSRRIAQKAISWQIARLYYSNMKRTRYLAELISDKTGCPAISDERLRELHFGQWELRSWDDIYTETGDAMNGFFDQPDRFSPSGGETTYQLRDRVLAWYRQLPETGLIVAVTHGGPIAALLGTLRNLPANQWMVLIPDYGELVEI